MPTSHHRNPPLIRCSMTAGGGQFLIGFESMEAVDLFMHQVHIGHTCMVKVTGWDRKTYYVRPSSVSLFSVRDNGHRDPQFPLPPIPDDDDFYDPGAP